MAELITSITPLVTFVWGVAIPTVISTIIEEPFLLISVGLMLAGVGIGMVRRVIGM